MLTLSKNIEVEQLSLRRVIQVDPRVSFNTSFFTFILSFVFRLICE